MILSPIYDDANVISIIVAISALCSSSLVFLRGGQASSKSPILSSAFTYGTNRLLDVDDFIAQLWDVHQEVLKQGYVQVRRQKPAALR